MSPAPSAAVLWRDGVLVYRGRWLPGGTRWAIVTTF
jgi:hypothetical protein